MMYRNERKLRSALLFADNVRTRKAKTAEDIASSLTYLAFQLQEGLQGIEKLMKSNKADDKKKLKNEVRRMGSLGESIAKTCVSLENKL